MESIRMQCQKLYLDAFHDDEEFTELLFDTLFLSSCRYITEGEKVVSILFAIDVTLSDSKGKYVYAVATDEAMRGKGYMRALFDKISLEFSTDYDFLCLKPMDEGLFRFYEKLGFQRNFKKSAVVKNYTKTPCELVLVDDINDVKRIRKSLLKENYVDYSNEFFKLILSYCDAFCDDKTTPSVFVVQERLSFKIKEVLGEYEKLPEIYCGRQLLTDGEEFDFAVIKPLKNKKISGYLGFALD